MKKILLLAFLLNSLTAFGMSKEEFSRQLGNVKDLYAAMERAFPGEPDYEAKRRDLIIGKDVEKLNLVKAKSLEVQAEKDADKQERKDIKDEVNSIADPVIKKILKRIIKDRYGE